MRIAIIGRTEILYETCKTLRDQGHEIALILTAKEAPEYTRTAEDFQALAENWKVPYIYVPRIDQDSIESMMSMPRIDIGVSLNYTGVIPQEFIDLFSNGILNAHSGDLPRYRGNACQAWAIINGEERIGLCIHKMVGGELDSGDIIEREYFPLTLETKVTAVYQWMSDRLPELFGSALGKLEKYPDYILQKQSTGARDALRCYPRNREDGRINWDRSAIEILRLINASNKPYAGAFCDLAGKELIIWDAQIAAEENFLAVPGQVTFVGDRFIEVATAEGKLRINEMEIDGETMTPDQIIHSVRQRLS